MSAGADRGRGAPPEWERLELAARRLMQEQQALGRRAADAEARIAELERSLRDVTGGLDAVALQRRAEAAERENAALRERLADADARVQRILARLDFLEEES